MTEYDLTLAELQVPDTCPECDGSIMVRDPDAGELICRGCGLVVSSTMLSHDPEWRIFEPGEMWSHPRAGAPMIPALAELDYTTLSRTWSHPDPEARATAHRLKRLQNKNNSSRARNFHQAKHTLLTLSEQVNMPRGLRDQAATLYRKAYTCGLVKGRTIQGVVAGCIYATYRLSGVPRSLKELAEAMNIDAKELSLTYRLLYNELNLRPENPRAEDHAAKLAEALGCTPEETQAALNILHAARRRRLTAGQQPQGLAAAAIYIATEPRLTQEEIARIAGVTSVTIRNQYKKLMETC